MIQVVISVSCGCQRSSDIANNPKTQSVVALTANKKKVFLFTLSHCTSVLDHENYVSPASLSFSLKLGLAEALCYAHWDSSSERSQLCAL